MDGWDASPLVLGAALLALVQFGRAFVRLRRRGRTDHAGWDRAALFAAGVAVSVIPLVSPLAGESLSDHMLEHVLVGDLGPALVLLAVRGPLLFFLVPAVATRLVVRRPALRAGFSVLARAWVAVAFWGAAYAAWHVPATYDLAAGNEAIHTAQHLSFVLAGMLLWAQLVDPAGRRISVGSRLAVAGAIFVLGQVLGDVFLLAGQPLYETYSSRDGALEDQQLAGLLMMVEQLVVLGAFAFLAVRSYVVRSPVRTTPA
jgi:putative membrane protein